MRSIAVINQKGGCGKTTIAINLSACLASQGKRTLLVDMDPQSHCAVGLAVPEDQIERNIYDVVIARYSQNSLTLKNIVWQIAQDFDLAPSGVELAALEQQLSGKDKREDCLKDLLHEQAGEYDYVIIDCPPSVGLLTFNALRAADEVIIPVETGYFALHGLARQIETLNVLQQQCSQDITFRVLPSMYDVRTKLAREILSELRKHHEAQMCHTVINFNTKLKEASSFGQPITEYDPASKGMKDFVALAQEIIVCEPQRKEEQSASAPAPAAQPEPFVREMPQVKPNLVASAVAVQRKNATAGTQEADTIDQKLDTIDAQLAAISKSATEIMAESQQVAPSGMSKVTENATIQEKIDNIYGVTQNQGKVRFGALYPKAQKVQLAGDFNGWQPEQTELTKTNDKGLWAVEMPLESGAYRYRYVVDGRWQEDPYNKHVEQNPFGELNSVVEVV
ncbi:MAG: AAA family ATPase [Sedimentisphaerales bacterium]|nr:AAA family ATPase [Sedimentisphaerales bacterium]